MNKHPLSQVNTNANVSKLRYIPTAGTIPAMQLDPMSNILHRPLPQSVLSTNCNTVSLLPAYTQLHNGDPMRVFRTTSVSDLIT